MLVRAPDPFQPLTLHITTQRFNVQRRMSKRVVDRDRLNRGDIPEARLGFKAATTTLSTACREARGARSDGYGVQDGCSAIQMADEVLARCRTDGRASDGRTSSSVYSPSKGMTSLLPPCPKPILEPTANSKPPNYHQVYASLVFGIMVFCILSYSRTTILLPLF